MAAPLGTWNMNANGTAGSLILSMGISGSLTGTLSLGGGPADPITAVWDETSQILSFSRATQGAPAPFAFEVYIGTLFQAYKTPNGLVAGEGAPLMLAGNFGTATAGGPVGPFAQFGWFATSSVKFKEKEGKEGKDVKDHKDGKEVKDKEGIEKIPRDLPQLPQFQGLSAVGMQAQADPASEVQFATGESFVSADERPEVGAAALQAGNNA
jgi:hypothetical protein